MTNIPQRKNVIKYQTSIDIPKENDKALIISKEQYITNDETLLIVRSVNNSEVTLNSNITKRIVIKSLTSVLVKPDLGLIDEEWDELLLEKGSCVQFQFVQGNWYILSSDGLKMS
jgi:hypothetical protein